MNSMLFDKKNQLDSSLLIKHFRHLLIALLTLVSLSGCTTVLVAGAIIGTVDVITDRRTVGEY
ncbi:MAG: hypothetical protein KTR16_02190, partial [Acidiferrobacterales bacterium]|nr:hypothetical protein [Acidiferrobacterales bacterium]